MKKGLFLLVLAATLSCHRDQLSPNSCGVLNPLKELKWLKDYVAMAATSLGEVTIYQAQYQGKMVFSVSHYYGPDAGSGALYQCDGSVICTSTITIAGQTGTCGAIYRNVTDPVLIYEKK